MTKQSSAKVRRYQAARTRLPNIMLTTVDRANLDTCIVRHGTTAAAVKCAVEHLMDMLIAECEIGTPPEHGERTGEQLQSVFLPKPYVEAWSIVSRRYGGAPKALRQALHEYAIHITKTLESDCCRGGEAS